MSDETSAAKVEQPLDSGVARQWAEEAIRLYRRYAIEVVEAFRLCPYAAKARMDGKVHEVVCLEEEPDVPGVLSRVQAIVSMREVEIGLLLFPRVRMNRLEWARFVEALRKAHQAEASGMVMAMEAFHPDAAADVRDPERLIPFLRRTPDPTIQLVRLEVLERVRKGHDDGTVFVDPSETSLDFWLSQPATPSLRERIARANHETVLAHGVAFFEALFADIFRDRDQSYARFRGVPAANRSSTKPLKKQG
ncbi:MAG: DUF1415 family protein [Sandaracinaceae bacterium]|nr:DUF1415 family protein [Sandaracinaceae bacterium]